MKILLFGEPLIRITPNQQLTLADQVETTMYYGGSEVNIAKTLQGFNIQTKLLTALPNGYLGDNFIHFLKSYQIDTSSISRVGKRIGLYYLEEGYGIRQSEVYYDRQDSSIQEMCHLDFDEVFKDITHFHFSGITIAVSEKTRILLVELLEEAKKRNIIISLDLNLRTKMISIEDAKKYFSKFATYADYCFGIDPIMLDEKDTTMFDRDHASIDEIQSRMQLLKDKYKFKAVFHTFRRIKDLMYNEFKSYILMDKFVESDTYITPILERVGSGDAFVSGAIYGLMNHYNEKDIVHLASSCATLKCTIKGDSMFVDIDKILKKEKGIVR